MELKEKMEKEALERQRAKTAGGSAGAGAKDFTTDHNGRMILVKKVNVVRLPANESKTQFVLDQQMTETKSKKGTKSKKKLMST